MSPFPPLYLVRSLMRPAILILLLAATAANAQVGDDNVWVLGSGTISCGKWLEEKGNKSLRAQRMQWLLGYVTAYNWSNTSRQAQLQDGQGALAFVDRYCSNNPLHTVVVAASALIEELGGPKASQPWRK